MKLHINHLLNKENIKTQIYLTLLYIIPLIILYLSLPKLCMNIETCTKCDKNTIASCTNLSNVEKKLLQDNRKAIIISQEIDDLSFEYLYLIPQIIILSTRNTTIYYDLDRKKQLSFKIQSFLNLLFHVLLLFITILVVRKIDDGHLILRVLNFKPYYLTEIFEIFTIKQQVYVMASLLMILFFSANLHLLIKNKKIYSLVVIFSYCAIQCGWLGLFKINSIFKFILLFLLCLLTNINYLNFIKKKIYYVIHYFIGFFKDLKS